MRSRLLGAAEIFFMGTVVAEALRLLISARDPKEPDLMNSRLEDFFICFGIKSASDKVR